MKILQELRKELKEKSSPEAKRAFRKFFKRNENIKSYGVKSGEVEKIAGKYYRKIKNLSKQEIFNLCEKLFSSKYMEEAFIASIWCQKLKNSFTKDDFNLFEKWIDKYIDNWAVCDGFCSRDISILIEKYPKVGSNFFYSTNESIYKNIPFIPVIIITQKERCKRFCKVIKMLAIHNYVVYRK